MGTICTVCPYSLTHNGRPCVDQSPNMDSCCDYNNLPQFEFTVQLRRWDSMNGEEIDPLETTADAKSEKEAFSIARESFMEDNPAFDWDYITANMFITGKRLLTVDEVDEVEGTTKPTDDYNSAAVEDQGIWWRNLTPRQVEREKKKAIAQGWTTFSMTDQELQKSEDSLPLSKGIGYPFPYPHDRKFDGLQLDDLQVK